MTTPSETSSSADTDDSLSTDELESQGYVPICEIDDVPSMRPKQIEVEDRDILICRDDDTLFAVDAICPHEDRSMRFGVVQRGQIICPHHQYRFDLETGRCRRRRCPAVPVYDLEVVDDTVYIQT